MEILVKSAAEEFVKGAQAIRSPDGVFLVDGKEVADTRMCSHCGMHWVPVKGSGKIRGFCTRCNGHLCGRMECMCECMSLEEWLTLQETGKRHSQVF